jgi:UBX domain-containing protein, putative
LQLIEEPNSTGRWLSDLEASPVISQIFRIYHSEKYSADDSCHDLGDDSKVTTGGSSNINETDNTESV